MVSSNASLSSGQISEARPSPEQTLFFQLYKRKDDIVAEERVKEVERQGYKAIFLTVDAIVAGHRERDIKAPFLLQDMENAEDKAAGAVNVDQGVEEDGEEDLDLGGTAGALLAKQDIDMTWEKVRINFNNPQCLVPK